MLLPDLFTFTFLGPSAVLLSRFLGVRIILILSMPRSMLPKTERLKPERTGVTSTVTRSNSVSTEPPALQTHSNVTCTLARLMDLLQTAWPPILLTTPAYNGPVVYMSTSHYRTECNNTKPRWHQANIILKIKFTVFDTKCVGNNALDGRRRLFG